MQVRVDDRRQHHEVVVAAGDLARHLDDPRQHARRLDDRDRRCRGRTRRGPRARSTKLRLLLTTCGNGCAGSSPIGVSSGRTSLREVLRRPCAFGRREFGAAHEAHAGALERGQHLVVEHAVLVARSARAPRRRPARAAARASCSVIPSGGDLGAQLLLQPATRISKNSSRLLPTMHRKRSRSSSGTRGSCGQRQHAPVEREQRQLAVDRRGVGVGITASARRGPANPAARSRQTGTGSRCADGSMSVTGADDAHVTTPPAGSGGTKIRRRRGRFRRATGERVEPEAAAARSPVERSEVLAVGSRLPRP